MVAASERLEELRNALKGLPPRVADTADRCWELPDGHGIRQIAEVYWICHHPLTPHSVAIRAESGETPEPFERKVPWEVRDELNGIADHALRLCEALKGISPDALAWIAEDAVARGDSIWPEWFWIPSHWMGREAIDWDTHEVLAKQLEVLDLELRHQASLAGLRRQESRGARTRSLKHDFKEELIAGLNQLLVKENGTPKAHVESIAQAIHRWATGDEVSGKWGRRARSRSRR